MKPWRRIDCTRLQACRVFDVDRVTFEPPSGGTARPFYRIDAPHWVNVIPLADDGRVLFVRQYRFGVQEFTLEIPGGMCDPDEPPERAAQRELREETGHEAGDLRLLGWVHPNPAIQTNRCYCYLARGLRQIGEPDPDENEAFEQLRLPLEEVGQRIAAGEITHALVVAAFHLLRARDPSRSV